MRLIITHDPDPPSPLTHQQVCKLVCKHRRYNLGTHQHDWRDWETSDEDVVVPLYLYDHSGITISTTPFQSRWDSGKVGIAVVSAETIRGVYGRDPEDQGDRSWIREHIIQSIVDEYDDYLRGQTWGYKLVETCGECGQTTGETQDSCWGFIGSDKEDIKKAMKPHLPEEITDNQFDKAWRKRHA